MVPKKNSLLIFKGIKIAFYINKVIKTWIDKHLGHKNSPQERFNGDLSDLLHLRALAEE